MIAPALWHPMMVHFPLALVVTAAGCLSAVRLRPAAPWAVTTALVGTWNLVLGAVGVLLALGTGLAAAMAVQTDVAGHQAVSAHVKSAILTTLFVFGVGLWRGLGVPPTSRPSWLFMMLLWIATASLLVTGYRGGQNVYRHGIGVSAPGRPPAASNAPEKSRAMRHFNAGTANAAPPRNSTA